MRHRFVVGVLVCVFPPSAPPGEARPSMGGNYMCRPPRLQRFQLPIFFVLVAVAPSAHAVGITLVAGPGTQVLSEAAFDGSVDGQADLPTSLPDSGTVTASTGGSSASTGFDLSNAAFELNFDQAFGAGEVTGSTYSSSNPVITFVPDADVGYVIAGIYSAVNESRNIVRIEVQLYDETNAVDLFTNIQESVNTPNESFTLGVPGADNQYSFNGSMTGTLLAGHQYRLFVQGVIDKFDSTSATDATATGNVSLSFVPEPGVAALLCGLGLAGLVKRGRLRT